MRPLQARLVTLCQQVLALGVVLVVLTPASGVAQESGPLAGITTSNLSTEAVDGIQVTMDVTALGADERDVVVRDGGREVARMTAVADRATPLTFVIMGSFFAAITTGGSPGCSSSAVSARPSSGAVPIILNALAVTSAPRTGSMRPSSVARLRTKTIAAPRSSTVFACSRQISKSCSERASG